MKKWKYVFLSGLLISQCTSNAYSLSGRDVYNETCVACHGANGKGTIPGAPDFTNSNGPLKNSDSVLLSRSLNGYQSPGSSVSMPAKGGNPHLSDQDVQNAISYIRKEFGRKQSSNTSKKNQIVGTKNNAIASVQPVKTNTELDALIARGAQAWSVTCSGCHNLRNPNEYSSEQWHTVTQHMRATAKLSGEKTREILAYLQSNSQTK